MTEAALSISHPDEILALFGPRDVNLRRIRKLFDVRITQRGGSIVVSGDDSAVQSALRTLEKLRHLSRKQGEVSPGDVTNAAVEEGALIDEIDFGGDVTARPPTGDEIHIQHAGRRIKPRTPGQAAYVDAIRQHDLTFATGPAGCGKTYLAVATAVEALKAGQIRKIVLVRPAVEAGENLGFLPGDLRAKLNPYLRPLLDALGEMVDFDQARDLMERETIEVIPLAYMRGRTLNDAFVILDEAQNSTTAQMKMFLTRLGQSSKMVVSGDATQQDLPRGVTSGLRDAIRRLENIEGIGFVHLEACDIVRHRLVRKIVAAYDDAPQRGPAADNA
jgi:phosphate starvation-inducible protein PhoH and related proteins